MSVSAGSAHTCAIQNSNLRLVCWGDNEYKQCEDRHLGQLGSDFERATEAEDEGSGDQE